jgi:polygalacturonase
MRNRWIGKIWLASAALLLAGTLRPATLRAQTALPFNVFTYGAAGNGTTLDTAAVQRAIDAAASAGSNAIVEIPPGFSFLVGTLVLRSGIDFNLDGELISSTNQADYSGDAVITASNALNLKITGTGDIAGRSLSFMTNYDRAGEWWLFAPWRPKMFMLIGCTNLEVTDITFGDAPYWGLHMLGCHNVLVDHVTVRNRLNVPNCDGIDADHCQQAEIRNCNVIAGDDAIVVKNTLQTTDYGPCANIHVHDCEMQTQDAGVKIGTETYSDIHDVVFERCHISDSGRGLTIQLRDQGGVSNVMFRDIQFISQYHADPWWGKGEGISLTAIPRTPETKLGIMQNIYFQNVSGRAENSVRIEGDPGSHIRNVRFENVAVMLERWTKYAGGRYDNRPTKVLDPVEKHATPGFNIRYADGVVFKKCTLHWGKSTPEYFTHALETDHVTGLELWDFKGVAAHPDRFQDVLFH